MGDSKIWGRHFSALPDGSANKKTSGKTLSRRRSSIARRSRLEKFILKKAALKADLAS
jgi:hypothetical protein